MKKLITKYKYFPKFWEVLKCIFNEKDRNHICNKRVPSKLTEEDIKNCLNCEKKTK